MPKELGGFILKSEALHDKSHQAGALSHMPSHTSKKCASLLLPHPAPVKRPAPCATSCELPATFVRACVPACSTERAPAARPGVARVALSGRMPALLHTLLLLRLRACMLELRRGQAARGGRCRAQVGLLAVRVWGRRV